MKKGKALFTIYYITSQKLLNFMRNVKFYHFLSFFFLSKNKTKNATKNTVRHIKTKKTQTTNFKNVNETRDYIKTRTVSKGQNIGLEDSLVWEGGEGGNL